MDLHMWLAFCVAAGIVLVIPGPTINAGLYALFAGHLRDRIARVGARRWFNRCGGAALIGAGVLTAALRRAA